MPPLVWILLRRQTLMAKAFFRRVLPDPEKIRAIRSLGFLGKRLAHPSIWHLNRRSASLAAFWGVFCACLPMPLQMIPGAIGAIIFRINLPLVIAAVWITNPFTMIPIMYLGYRLGSWALDEPAIGFHEVGLLLTQLTQHTLSMVGLAENVVNPERVEFHMAPLILGNVMLGLIAGTVAYIVVRLLWRWHAVKLWQRRMANRQQL